MMNQTKYKKYIQKVSLSFLTIFSIYFLSLLYINPKQTFNFFSQNKFTKHNDNFVFNKSLIMEKKNNFDTVIIGSSTSECFVPADVNYLLNAKTFLASTGGGNSITRFALLKGAIGNFKKLKRIIYIVDLFEFNNVIPKAEVMLNTKLRSYVNSKNLELNLLAKIKHIFSHQSFEALFHVLKKTYKDKITQIRNDGTTYRSMITSPIKNTHNYKSKINLKQKKELSDQIKENYITYSRSVLNNFQKLSPITINLFNRTNQLSIKQNLQVIYILAPYHYNFRKMLFKDLKVKKRYKEWQLFFTSFTHHKNIKVYNPLNSIIATDPMSGVWRDGIHFNRQSCAHILYNISNDLSPINFQGK